MGQRNRKNKKQKERLTAGRLESQEKNEGENRIKKNPTLKR